MQKSLITIALSILLTIVAFAQSNVLTGKFVDLQMGDYAHVEILDAAGESRNFWLGSDPSLNKVVEHPEWYRGKKVKVTWHKVTRNIPEAGGNMEIEEITRLEVLKK